MFLLIALLSTFACVAAAATSGMNLVEASFLRSVGPTTSSAFPFAIIAATKKAMKNIHKKDTKTQALASSAGVTPMVSSTVPSGFVTLNGCGNNQAVTLPMGLCVFEPANSVYLTYTATSTGGVNTIVINVYSDSACTNLVFGPENGPSGGCSLNENIFSVGAPSTSIPAIPAGAGVVQKLYTTSGCGSLAGWAFIPQGVCIAGDESPPYSYGTCSSSSVSISTYAPSTATPPVCASPAASTATETLATSCTAISSASGGANPYLTTVPFFSISFGINYYSDSCQAAAAVSEEAAVCFAGSETVTLASGETKAIADVSVGDSVLAFSVASGKTVVTDVVATPHPRNNIQANFQHIVTEAGSDIKMTADHLILAGACSANKLALIRAVEVSRGSCIQTLSGQEVVASNDVVRGEGLYTIVTEKSDHLVVVNNIVASSFAVNHAVGNAVYAIHRIAYAVAPALIASAAFKTVNVVASNLAAYFTK